MKTTSAIAGALGGLLLASTISMASPYQGMTIEAHASHDWGTSYRIYANLAEGARVDAVYGNAQGTLSIAAANGAVKYHDAAGGATSQAINSNFFQFVPSMEHDTYVSIGALHADGHPFGGNNLNDIGIDFSDWEGGSNELTTDNGSWFVTPDDEQGGEVDGRVFVAQVTIQGGTGSIADVVGQVNLQGKDADGNTWNEVGATWVPAPGALALLGLAGIAGRRRRRA